MLEAIVFYSVAGLILAAALCVVFSRQPIFSVLSLLVAMFLLATLFVMLGAYFVAALQILLYAGAVLVLFLFIMMLLNLEVEATRRSWTHASIGLALALVFCVELIQLFAGSLPARPLADIPVTPGTVESIGRLMLTRYAIPFELTSLLILAAIIGAITLAQSRSEK